MLVYRTKINSKNMCVFASDVLVSYVKLYVRWIVQKQNRCIRLFDHILILKQILLLLDNRLVLFRCPILKKNVM